MALRIRKNQADLSSDERLRFTAAVNKMKTDGTYDWYVRTHLDSMWMLLSGDMTMWAHMRPAFLPWHRQLLLDFENDLRDADAALRGQPSDLALPYWDWINYRSKKKFLWWGRIWGSNFMGGNGDSSNDNRVTDGPFQGWTLSYDAGPNYQPFTPHGPAYLQRTLGRDIDSLPTQEHWDGARALTTYDTTPWDSNVGSNPQPVPTPVHFAGIASFRNVFEGWVPYFDTATSSPVFTNLHNRVHVWVGGSMEPTSSPNDPVFFLHHCNVDRLWAQWWADDPTRPYLPPDGVTNPVDPLGENAGSMHTGPNETINLTGHHLHDPMPPWDGRTDPLKGTMPTITPAQLLNHIALGYAYDTDPPALAATAKP